MQGITAATAGAGFFVWNERTYAESKSPNEQINIAWVGVGGKGGGDSDQAGQVGKLIAICDIDENTLGQKAEKFPDAQQFTDSREMIEQLGDKVDAVGVSTPDHNHYPAAMLAMKNKKHVYCQKPLTHTVWEARQLREAAKKFGVKTQMGNQGSASDGLRKGAEYLRAGVIGTIKEIHVWTNRPIWPQAPKVVEPPAEAPVPANVHWNFWLGPAPVRAYAKGQLDGKEYKPYHPFAWRGWWDFGTGALGDMACHTANMAFYGAELKYPTSVQAEAGDVNPQTYPSWAHIMWDFPAPHGKEDVIKFHWYEGKRDGKLMQPASEMFTGVKFGEGGMKMPASGALIVGSKGSMFQTEDYGSDWKLLPETDFKDVKGPTPTLKRHKGDNDLSMKKEWVAAIKGEIDQSFSHFGYAGVLTEAMLLGNVAIKNHGQKLMWNGAKCRFTNNEQANTSVRLRPRAGWAVTM
jgi:predicted dehydrogenase